MKFSKLLSKLGIKSKSNQSTQKNNTKEVHKEAAKERSATSNATTKTKIKKNKYPQSIFELIKNHINDSEAEDLIIEKLYKLDESARVFALESLMDSFAEDSKVIKILNKYLNLISEEDKIWALRDFAFHRGNLKRCRELISEHITFLESESKYYLLTDLAVHHGSDIEVQKLIVEYINNLSNQHKYDVLYCLSHLHGLNQAVQNLILSNLNGLNDTQKKEIFRGLMPKVAADLIEKHLESLSEKNRNELLDKASKVQSNDADTTVKADKDEIVLLDLGNVKKTKTSGGGDNFKIHFNNPVKIYPYVEEKNDDTQIGDAFLTVKNDKIYATITLCPQLRKTIKKTNKMKPIYKPSGNLAIYKGEAQQMSVDFIYMVF